MIDTEIFVGWKITNRQPSDSFDKGNDEDVIQRGKALAPRGSESRRTGGRGIDAEHIRNQGESRDR